MLFLQYKRQCSVNAVMTLATQLSLTTIEFLPPAYVVRQEVMFSQVCVCSGRGVTPSQVRMGGYPIPGLVWGVAPRPGLDGRGGTPPARSGWWMGTPPAGSGWWGGTPPGLDGVPPPTPIRQSSIASTCYLAGGMPLAFTQEDFLGHHKIKFYILRQNLHQTCFNDFSNVK